MKVKIKLLSPDAILPSYAYPGDAGLDLFALKDEEILPGERKRVDFGLALEFPDGFVALTRDRGSLAKNGIHNLGGVFDAGYRGEYNCTLVNLSQETCRIKKGDKVALEPANPAYETRIFGPDRVQVQGRLVGLIRKY